jgi:nucleotide-binding universal stress UspA family protein
MGDFLWAVVAFGWLVEALVLGHVMGRRGYDAYSWTLIGLFLGPLAVAVALSFAIRAPSWQPKFLHSASRGTGPVDVLVGIDGSRESTTAAAKVRTLFGSAEGRVTFAQAIPLDATVERERVAERQLVAASAAHPELDPSTVVLRGEPVAALRDYAFRLGYEVLVVGARGKGRTKALLGSVATGLARGGSVPVLPVDTESEGGNVANRAETLSV